eukprot:TRINITY_DN10704_c0_g1_i1.p1 TRINITY_DN10704_c0_g1~~TRINITY_DN10704_c0_g1_i1.p1  ORF type:complete len:244 (+),score=47.27 TRINITY_DN10704_c0_g1_i1:19-750(+)
MSLSFSSDDWGSQLPVAPHLNKPLSDTDEKRSDSYRAEPVDKDMGSIKRDLDLNPDAFEENKEDFVQAVPLDDLDVRLSKRVKRDVYMDSDSDGQIPYVVSRNNHYQLHVYLTKASKILIFFAIIYGLFSLISFIFEFYFLIGGVIVSPLGVWSLYKLRKAWVLVFAIGCGVEILAHMVSILLIQDVYSLSYVVIANFIIISIKVAYTYSVFRFWRKIPYDSSVLRPFNTTGNNFNSESSLDI